MGKTETSIVINAPVEKVFAYIDDPTSTVEWLPYMTEIKDITLYEQGAGSHYRWVFKTDEMILEGESTIIEHIRNQRIITQSKGGVVSTWTWTFEPLGGRTKLNLVVEYTVPVPALGKLSEAVIVRMVQRELEASLGNLQGILGGLPGIPTIPPADFLMRHRSAYLKSIAESFNVMSSRISNIVKKFNPPTPINLELSVAYPKLLSKRFSSPFKVAIYPPGKQREVGYKLNRDSQNQYIKEFKTELTTGITVVIKLSSQDIEFVEPTVTKKLGNSINIASFSGKPKDTCHPGPQTVKLSITDEATSHEYVSQTFEVRVVDFAFDHVSKPLLSQLASAVLGLASMATWILTFLGQVDKTFGLTSGTIASLATAFIYGRFHTQYKRPSDAITVSSKQT